MPKPSLRPLKVAELIQREVAAIILRDWEQPLPGLITISLVEMSPDLKYAKIYVSVFGEENTPELLVKALNESRAPLRKKLAQRVLLRYIPEIKFYVDDLATRAAHLQQLIDK